VPSKGNPTSNRHQTTGAWKFKHSGILPKQSFIEPNGFFAASNQPRQQKHSEITKG
jgi:hypothetical protein